jgi:Putative lumazine-binding
MRSKIFTILLTVIISLHASAQNAQDSVRNVINDLFIAMKNGDAGALKNTFSPTAILQTIRKDKDGNITVHNEEITAFADFVSKQPKGAADERIQFETIRVDGPLAIAWTPYHFYFNGNFSHCGVNSFQLLRLSAGWKIQYLIDTRRKEGCE